MCLNSRAHVLALSVVAFQANYEHTLVLVAELNPFRQSVNSYSILTLSTFTATKYM